MVEVPIPKGFRDVRISVDSFRHTTEELADFIKRGFKLDSRWNEEEKKGVIWVKKIDKVDDIPVEYTAFHKSIVEEKEVFEAIRKKLEEVV